MHTITARNVNTALHTGLWWLRVAGVTEKSRNGDVRVAPGPVITEYRHPLERVLFSVARNANPYFHVFEALWMLSGRNDLAWVQQFNSRFTEFSDDGVTLHGAYGHRWRNWRGMDQIPTLIQHLKDYPDTRRAVLSMWDPELDLGTVHKDIPCNNIIYFDLRGGCVNMTVCCRSNDLIWGVCGANSVHFSYLFEYIAASINTPVGVYRQFSNNYHVYLDLKGYPSSDPNVIGMDDRYLTSDLIEPFPLIHESQKAFDHDLEQFLRDPLRDGDYLEPFFSTVAVPMYASWHDRKNKKNGSNGLLAAESIGASDWKTACVEWIARRTVTQNA